MYTMTWLQLGKKIVKYKVAALTFLALSTIVMGYFAMQVKLSYEFTKAIPEDNPKYVIYQDFVKKFGVDGTTMVVGFQTDSFFTTNIFNQVADLQKDIKTIPGVTEVVSVPSAYTLVKDSIASKFIPHKIFNAPYTSDSSLAADRAVLERLPFYKNLMYNPISHSYIMAISFLPDSINSGARSGIINKLKSKLDAFAVKSQLAIHISGLPYIRTILAERIKKEIGSAIPTGSEKTFLMKGRDIRTGTPKEVILTEKDTAEALEGVVNQIVNAVKHALENTPPELSSDLVDSGMVLAGGGAYLKNLDKLIKKETGLPVTIAEDALSCVAIGTGKALEQEGIFSSMLTSY